MDEVGDYMIWYKQVIAHGSFGTVHKATNKTTSEVVMAKRIIMMDGARKNTEMESMAKKELDILTSLQSHQNIVKLISHKQTDDSMWLFLEFCDKGHLGNYLKDNPDMPLYRKLTIISEIISALVFMHGHEPQIIHRDLKLENILLKFESTKDIVKVTDFGSSKINHVKKTLSNVLYPCYDNHTECGSKYFMAPEFFAELEGGVKYDETVDTFSLGLIMKVMIEYSPDNTEQLPLSVSAKKASEVVAYGKELVRNFRNNRPLPSLFDKSRTVDSKTNRLQRIVVNMTAFQPKERKRIAEVDEEITELLKEMKEQQHDNMTAASQHDSSAQARQTATVKLDLLSLTSSTLHEERRVELLDRPRSLCVAHGRLYTCEGSSGLAVYSLDLENLGHLIEGRESYRWIDGAAEAGEDTLAVASVAGLFVVSKTAPLSWIRDLCLNRFEHGPSATIGTAEPEECEVLQQLSKGCHEDVCLGCDGRLYALFWSSSTDRDSEMAGGSSSLLQVHVYQRQHGSWVKAQQYDTPCTISVTSIAHINSIIYISCCFHNILKRKFGQETEEGWQEIDTVKVMSYPCVAAIDEKGRVLITDMHNRLVVLSDDSRITELRTEPALDCPVSAVITGSKLYVCCLDKTLRCFKLE